MDTVLISSIFNIKIGVHCSNGRSVEYFELSLCKFHCSNPDGRGETLSRLLEHNLGRV